MAAVPSEELRTVLWMFVILLTANFKFRNHSTCSKRPMKKAGKVCRDSQDLKSPGTFGVDFPFKAYLTAQNFKKFITAQRHAMILTVTILQINFKSRSTFECHSRHLFIKNVHPTTTPAPHKIDRSLSIRIRICKKRRTFDQI